MEECFTTNMSLDLRMNVTDADDTGFHDHIKHMA